MKPLKLKVKEHQTDMTKPAGEKVPKQIQSKFEEISALTDAFCNEHLNPEYTALCRQLTAALCRLEPSPLAKGQAKSWAGGIIHALGKINHLYSPYQPPYMKVSEFFQLFGVAQGTATGKSKQIRKLMNMGQYDQHWFLPSQRKKHPLIQIADFKRELEIQRKGYLKRSDRLY